MESYDISHLPQPVHDAVLHLMETLVQAFPPLSTGVEPQARTLPTVLRCPHATDDTPCCPACTVLHRAEAVLAEVQVDLPERFPRSALARRILEALQQLAPLPIAPRQLATMLGLPREQVQLLCQALATLDMIDHPDKGYYRHKATGTSPTGAAPFPLIETAARAEEGSSVPTPALLPFPGQRETHEQQVLAAVRAAFPRPVSPQEIREQCGIAQARTVLMTLRARGQVEWVRYGQFRYRGLE